MAMILPDFGPAMAPNTHSHDILHRFNAVLKLF